MAAASKSIVTAIIFLNLTFSALVSTNYVPCPPKTKPTIPKTTPTKPSKCPRDTLKLGICGDWLGLVHEVIGTQPSKECCTVIKGLADLEAALCLCTVIKANVLGILNVKVPIAISLALNSCGKKVPEGFQCA